MTFKEAVEATPNLAGRFQKGLHALRAQDRPHIEAENTRKLVGSVDVDSALQLVQPNANRWDFAIAYQHTNRGNEVIYWTELHTASDSEVKVVIKKAVWLRGWLKDDGSKMAAFECDIVWISSGPTSFQLTGPQRKQMAQAGLRHVGSRLRIRNKR
jgi:hypothetical protein